MNSEPIIIGEKKEVKPNRAERRRMMRDPLFNQKMTAGNEYVEEYRRLIAYGQILVYQMSDVQLRMAGLGMQPKKLRASIQEKLTNEWNEITEKLEGIQKQMESIEKEKEGKPLFLNNE